MSGGACSTIMREPIKQRAHPTRPTCPSSSLRRNDASTALVLGQRRYDHPYNRAHPIRTLSAPSGVTRMGGANKYAEKFATKRAIQLRHEPKHALVHTFTDHHFRNIYLVSEVNKEREETHESTSLPTILDSSSMLDYLTHSHIPNSGWRR